MSEALQMQRRRHLEGHCQLPRQQGELCGLVSAAARTWPEECHFGFLKLKG